MTATLDPIPQAPASLPDASQDAAPTLSLIYSDDTFDWADASKLEIRIEAGYLREWLRREDSAAAREELKRVTAAAKLLRITL